MVLACRRALLLRWPQEPKRHLWVILTDPDGDPPTVAIVPLRTQRVHSDSTVVLQPGDHPFIQHPTVVHYSDLQVVRVAALIGRIRANEAKLTVDVRPDVFARICAGVERSPFTVKAHLDYCRGRIR